MADKLKNLLLAVLLVLMAVLLVLTFWVSAQGAGGQFQLLQETEETIGAESAPVAAAQPEVLALVGESGVYLAEYAEEYTLLWQQAEPVLQEAVGSAGTPEAIEETAYLKLLQAPAVLVQYHAAQPFYLMQHWGGSEMLTDGPEVRGAALAREDDAVVLLLTDKAGGRWKAATAASLAELESLCANATEVNAMLAKNSRALSGDEVLSMRVGTFAQVAVSDAEVARKGELSQSIQSLFGMNPYLTRVYPEADGSLVYVESHSTVSLAPNGDLAYAGTGIDLEVTASGTLVRQAEISRKVCALLRRLWQQTGASGVLSLEELELSGDDGVLRFGLQLNGVFLERNSGSWATVTVKDGVITGLNASPRLLTESGNVLLLPGYQAATVLPQGQARLRVRLLEQRDGTMVPQRCSVED